MDEHQESILNLLETKSSHKQATYRNTLRHFENLKGILQKAANYYGSAMKERDPYVEVSYHSPNLFDAELKFSGDLLVFSMHSNVFTFDHKHFAYQTAYVKENNLRAYCGVINVYNFLADSYKYKRMNDVGFLLARIFVNTENHFFVEGTRLMTTNYSDFGNQVLDEPVLEEVVQRAILQSLQIDLQVPAFEQVQAISVGQKMTEHANSGLFTGKKLGYAK